MSFKPEPYNLSLKKIFPHVIEARAKLMCDHYQRLEVFYDSERGQIEEKIKKYEIDNDVECDDKFIEYSSDLIVDIEIGYKRNLKISSVMLTYSFLESSMELICKEYEAKNTTLVSVTDLSGNGIERSKKYLEKVAEYDFSEINKEWSKASFLAKVRNCLAHCEGDIERYKSGTRFKGAILATPELSIEEGRLISVSSEYILDSINNIKLLLIKLLSVK